MGIDIALVVILFFTGLAAGIYISSQIELRISRKTRPAPTNISVSYIEQGSGTFYGMYIYNDSNRICKLSNIDQANGVLRSFGIEIELPDRIAKRDATTDLNNIMGQFNSAHNKYCSFDWDQCMDVS
jgi:hypothetical protein